MFVENKTIHCNMRNDRQKEVSVNNNTDSYEQIPKEKQKLIFFLVFALNTSYFT